MKPIGTLLKTAHGQFWSVSPEDTVFNALQLLAQHEVGALMVMQDGKLVGVVSERDYTRKVALQGKNSKEAHVRDIMTADVLVVSPKTRSRECMEIMATKNIRHLPVVDGTTIVGMLSIRDLMNDIIKDHESTIAHLESYIHQ